MLLTTLDLSPRYARGFPSGLISRWNYAATMRLLCDYQYTTMPHYFSFHASNFALIFQHIFPSSTLPATFYRSAIAINNLRSASRAEIIKRNCFASRSPPLLRFGFAALRRNRGNGGSLKKAVSAIAPSLFMRSSAALPTRTRYAIAY